MRRLFYWFGVFAVALTMVFVVGIGYLAYNGSRLDKESKIYAESAVDAITSHWNGHELLVRASPNLMKSVTSNQISSMFDWLGLLGSLTSSGECKGSSIIFTSIGQPRSTIANYVCNEQYHNGAASIRISLVKIANKWMVNGINVSSPLLLAHKPI